ncbi:FxLD family lanthipeptide [Plantactinospora sp. CA-290183]|uniref:FxLD family lanthipeptide n=1 Tax=Plantactinospora sp. CA-290183 TaxID=3240006 RepID=UPI003D8A124C
MAPMLTLDGMVKDPTLTDALDFDLPDMRVIEATTPLTSMACSTNDGCGSTCSGSACSSSSNDPS